MRRLDRGRASTPAARRRTSASDAAGRALFVKALGDDERSADVLFRLYRRLNPRDLGDEKPFSSLRRAVEHEALVALAARDLGVRTPRLARVRHRQPQRLRARLRGDRGPVARPASTPPRSPTTCSPRAGARGPTAPPPHRPPRPASGQHLPRRRRRGVAHRLRLQRAGRLRSAARHRRRRAGRVVEHPCRRPSGRSPTPRPRSTRRRWHGHSIASAPGRSAARPGRRSRRAAASSTTCATACSSSAAATAETFRRDVARTRATEPPCPPMNPWWLIVAGVGLVVAWAVGSPRPQADDQPGRVTDLPRRQRAARAGCIPLLWLPMQLGNLVGRHRGRLVVALVDRDLTVAIGVVLAMVLKLVAERVVRQRDGRLSRRPPAAGHEPARRHAARWRRAGVGPELPVGPRDPRRRRRHASSPPMLPSVWWWVPGPRRGPGGRSAGSTSAPTTRSTSPPASAPGSCWAACWRPSSPEGPAPARRSPRVPGVRPSRPPSRQPDGSIAVIDAMPAISMAWRATDPSGAMTRSAICSRRRVTASPKTTWRPALSR